MIAGTIIGVTYNTLGHTDNISYTLIVLLGDILNVSPCTGLTYGSFNAESGHN